MGVFKGALAPDIIMGIKKLRFENKGGWDNRL